MASPSPLPTPSADPYAAYGGSTTTPATQPAATSDPYSAYGGNLASAGASTSSLSASSPTLLQKVNTALTNPSLKPYIGDAGEALAGGLKDTAEMVGNILHMVNKPAGPGPFASKDDTDLYNRLVEADPVHRHVEDAANWLKSGGQPSGFWENVGSVGAEAAQWLGGEELLKLAGGAAKAGEAIDATAHLAQAGKVAKVLQENPRLAGLVTIGLKASKDALMSAGLNYAHTGSVQDALTAGATTGVLSGGVGTATKALEPLAKEAPAPATKTIEGVTVPVPKEAEAQITPSAAKGAEAYAATARAATKPHLESANAFGERPVMMNQPGGQPAVPAGTIRLENTPKVDVDRALNQIHDFTGAADQLTEAHSAAYDALDAATNGQFRALNADLAQAQKAAWKGGPDEQRAYQEAQRKMDTLLDNTKIPIRPDELAAIKAGFRQSYLLRDFGNLWDRNLNGVPGASQVSQTQRGINGNGLMRSLQQTIRNTRGGRQVVEAALGPGRLENLEDIARLNQTNAQRKAFNVAVQNVARHLPPGTNHFLAGTMGGAVGHMTGIGGWEGAAAGELGYLGYTRVMNALKTNPAIARNLIFAIRSGARPEFYGPMIANMVRNSAASDINNQGGQTK